MRIFKAINAGSYDVERY